MVDLETHTPQFTQADVVKITRATEKTLQNWTNRGLLVLDQQNPGRAQRRFYSVWDMVKVRTMLVLTKLGISAAFASKFAEDVVKHQVEEIDEHLAKPDPEKRYGSAKSAYILMRGDEPELIVSKGVLDSINIEASRQLVPPSNPQAYICIEIDTLIFDTYDRAFRLLVRERFGDDKFIDEALKDEEWPGP